MSERDIIGSEDNGEGRDKSVESAESKQEERSLEDVTTRPESHVEATADYKEAEKVETVFVDVVGTDKKVDQTDPPGTTKEKVESSGPGKIGGDPATPINLPSPESKAGTTDEKTEPDPKEGAEGVDSSLKTESMEKGEEETTPEKLEATPITLPDKEGAKATPSKPDEVVAEKPEQMRMGVEKETNLADGIDGMGVEIPGVKGLPEDDPFGQGGMGPDVNIGGEGEKDLSGIAPDFQETIKQAQGEQKPSDPGTIGGGPGSVHPNYGPSGRGMVSEPVKPKTPSGGQDSGGDQGGTQPKSKTKSKTNTDTTNRANIGSKKAVHMAEIEAMKAAKAVDEAVVDLRSGTGTKEDLDQAESDFAAAQRNLNFMVMEYDLAQAKKGIFKMPRPDEEDTGVEAPQSEEDIKREDMVVDPASFQGVTPSSGVSTSKHPGLVSDPAEPQGPDTPDGGIKTDRTLTTDPPGEELGKEKGKSEE